MRRKYVKIGNSPGYILKGNVFHQLIFDEGCCLSAHVLFLFFSRTSQLIILLSYRSGRFLHCRGETPIILLKFLLKLDGVLNPTRQAMSRMESFVLSKSSQATFILIRVMYSNGVIFIQFPKILRKCDSLRKHAFAKSPIFNGSLK